MATGNARGASARGWLGWADSPTAHADASTPEAVDVPATFRRRFAAAAGNFHVAERFDDTAARLYFDAEDPPIVGDQQQSIRRLRARRREMIGTPLITSHEEQDPRFGPWTMSVLTFGDYADHLLANNSYIHLNNPPITIPPRVLDVHFCWGARTYGAASASVLHAVAALIVDDWRSALRDVPVRFHLHRLGPEPHSVTIGPGGRRWRDRSRSRLPPGIVVGALFSRANRAHAIRPLEIAAAASDGRRPRSETSGQWWCACLCEADLPLLGFRRGADRIDSAGAHVWSSLTSTLPTAIEHVFLIPTDEDEGAFYRVDRTRQAVTLAPIRRRRGDIDLRSWHRLRVQALDVALDELLARMH